MEPEGGALGLAHAIAQLVESAADAHCMMHWPHGAFLPISAITAAVVSAAVPTPITSDTEHAAPPAAAEVAGAGGVGAFGAAVGDGGGGAGGDGPAPPLEHAIAQLVESAAEAHFIMHWPHGAFLPMRPITADVGSAAVPTPITSSSVHTAAVAIVGARATAHKTWLQNLREFGGCFMVSIDQHGLIA